jgi:hypothetical protein
MAVGSFSTSRWSAAGHFGGFLPKVRGVVALGDLGDASWLDGRARAASKWLGDGGGLESKRRWDLVL